MTRLGRGSRICIVLSVGFVLAYSYIYKAEVEYWEKYSRCQSLINTPPPPIGFALVAQSEAGSPHASGKQRYEVCFRVPPFSADDPLPSGCSIVIPNSNPRTAAILEGPKDSSQDAIETAAFRLGLAGDMLKSVYTPQPNFSSPSRTAEYQACVTRFSEEVIEKPQFDYDTVLVAFAWIWGIYGVIRFIRGK